MRPIVALLLSSAVLYAAAAWSAVAHGRGPCGAGFGRDLVRPLLLPFLWRSLADAEKHGTIAEEIGKARLLMQLLPRWSDGHIVFAYRLALRPAASVEGGQDAASRLDAAIAWLDEARSGCTRRGQTELLEAMAFLVELAADRDPELATTLERRGTPAALWADRILARAQQVSDSAALRERRIFMAPRLMAHFLRLHDKRGALDILEGTLEHLAEVRDRELASRWQQSLMRLWTYWKGDRRVERADLLGDPLLADLAPYLE